jgi:hypothetical protein
MNFQNKNLLELMIPGLYEIQCIQTKKVYIGESENLLARFGKHAASLTQNKHDCKELQQDWNQFGKQGFEFKIICFGEAYSSQDDRRKKEQSVIKQKIKQSCSLYNTNKATSFIVNYRREIEIDGEIFLSVAQAAKHPTINISETTIRRRLLNVNYPTYKEIQRPLNGYTPVTINNKKFESINAAVEAGVANTRQTVMRRVSSTNRKWANWKISE